VQRKRETVPDPGSSDSKVRWQLTEQRFIVQQRQFELYALPDRQPMEPTKYWRNMLTASGASDKTRCRILNAL